MIKKIFVKFCGCLFICFVCFNFGLKKTKIIINSVTLNMRLPFFASFVPRNTFIPRFICFWFWKIFAVLRNSSQSKIGPSIVMFNSVNMINFNIIIWPIASLHSPYHSVCPEKSIINSYKDITSPIFAQNFLSLLYSSFSYFPTKVASYWIVAKGFQKSMHAWLFHKPIMVTCPLVVKGIY